MRVLRILVIGFLMASCTHVAQGARATWDEERWGEVEQQMLDNSCGLSSLLTIMRHHFGDDRFDERALLMKYIGQAREEALQKAMRDGVSLLEIEALAQSLGYKTVRKMLGFRELERIVSFAPVLVYLEIGSLRHFAVVRGISGEVVLLADPARGNVYYTRNEFLAEWRVPEALKDIWAHPGGLILKRAEAGFHPAFLKEPAGGLPASFFELRRHMLLWQ